MRVMCSRDKYNRIIRHEIVCISGIWSFRCVCVNFVKKFRTAIEMETPGIMDSVLRPYLEAITQYYNANESKWTYLIKRSQFDLLRNAREYTHRRKNLDNESQSFREQGNAYFKALDFTQALELYTKSISAAHEGPLAALAYFNRSAALFQMKLYEDCIKDIDRAISSRYPKQENLYSLYLRKAKCLKFLNRNYDGCLAKAMKAIKDHSKDADAKRLVELVTCKIEEPEPVFNVKLPKPNDKSWKLPELSYGQNPEVPCFSSAIDLVHSNELGRHIIANRDINTGDVLIVEESIITSMFSYFRWNFCNFCFKYCNTHLIPGKSCGYMMYCSKNCRDSDWNAEHESICQEATHPTCFEHFKLEKLAMAGGMDYALAVQSMVLGLSNVFGLDNIKQTVLENKPIASLLGDPRTRGFQNGKFQEITLKALFSLEDNVNNAERDAASEFALCMCGYLHIKPEQFLTVGAFFAKLYHVVVFNYIAVDYFKANYGAEAGQKRLTLGLGMYLASSLVNHSCDSNMYHVSYGSSIVFRAKRPIKKGEQLTDCYDNRTSTKFNFEQRKSLLWESYKFKCGCLACLDPSSATLDRLPPYPKPGLNQYFLDVGLHLSPISGQETLKAMNLVHCCALRLPATKQMLPKMLALLQSFHASGEKSNRFYFELQKCIQNHFSTEGNCFFFGNAKDILSGELDYDK